jgi:hypothetical protein
MLIVDLLGFIFLKISLRCLMCFFSLKNMLNVFLIARLFMFKLIGEVSMKNSILSFRT